MRGAKSRVRNRDVNRPPPMMGRCRSKRPQKGGINPRNKLYTKKKIQAIASNLSETDKPTNGYFDYFEALKKGEEKERKEDVKIGKSPTNIYSPKTRSKKVQAQRPETQLHRRCNLSV